jgi:hypothetical protein
VRLSHLVDPGHHAGAAQRLPAAEAPARLSGAPASRILGSYKEHATMGLDNLVSAE